MSTIPLGSCRSCLSYRTRSWEYGQCWHESHPKVPVLKARDQVCEHFQDELKNRADWPFKEAK